MSEAGERDGGWIGDAPSWPEALATLWGGVAALMISGVQPLVFGPLVDAGLVGLAGVGRIATAESLGTALGATLAPWLLGRGVGARALGFAAAVGLTAGNLAMPLGRGLLSLAALRAGVGVTEGALLALTIAMSSRAPEPERWSGAFLGGQTAVQVIGAWAIPALLAPRFGASGGFVLLAGLGAVACLTAPFGARAHRAPPDSPMAEHRAALPRAAWLGLAFVVVSLASSVAVWAYFERIGDAIGLTPTAIGAAASLSLVAQALGSFLAMALGARLGWLAATALGAAAQAAAMLALASAHTASAFTIAGAAFGFAWLFGLPYQMRALVELDPSRNAAQLSVAAQVAGTSLGPLAASLLVREGDLGDVLGFGAIAAAVALGVARSARRLGEPRRS